MFRGNGCFNDRGGSDCSDPHRRITGVMAYIRRGVGVVDHDRMGGDCRSEKKDAVKRGWNHGKVKVR